ANGRGAGALVTAQRSWLLPRGLRARTFSNTGIDVAGRARIDEPLQAGRVVVKIDAGDRALAHADGGAAVAGDEAAEKLEQDWIVAHSQHSFAAGVFDQHVLESTEGRVGQERVADFNLAVVAELGADKLCGLQSALERAADDYVHLNFEGA